MNTLDFGEIMERADWFEDYDIYCPHCEGEGSFECPTCRGEGGDPCEECELGEIDGEPCPVCGGFGYIPCKECHGDGEVYCEHCVNGMFDILWNTAFSVSLSGSMGWAEARRFAWDRGFLLIEHGNFAEKYLVAGMAGLDFTWILHYTRWKIQGFLEQEDYRDLLTSGGHVFLSLDEKLELAEYLKTVPPTPEEYGERYEREMERIHEIIRETS